jgi:hypothetical protein
MNLNQRIALCAGAVDLGFTVVPHAHPPSLRNPKKVTQDTATDGWHPSDSEQKKRQARKDMKTILDRTLRQAGRPVMVRHATQNTQSSYAPTPFY